MKKHAYLLILMIIMLVGTPIVPAAAQDGPPVIPGAFEAGDKDKILQGASFQHDQAAPTPMPPGQQTDNAIPLAEGGPDDFGYRWSELSQADWFDATTGTNTGITGDDVSSLVDIGFSFHFYEQTWSQVYVNTNGILIFGQSHHGCCGSSPIPSQNAPNNVAAALWNDLTVGAAYNTGAIYVLRGGSAPNRFMVIEWLRATYCCAHGATDYKTFEIILYENGNMDTRYLDLIGLQRARVGIEDSTGTDGLEYTEQATNGKGVRFTRPIPAARAHVSAIAQGQFVFPGKAAAFPVSIRNTGDLGSDTFDLTASSGWQVSYFQQDGVTPLGDTDGDSLADTGQLQPGQAIAISVAVQTPPNVGIGVYNQAALFVTSSRDTNVNRTAALRTSVPAPFRHAYRDYGAGNGVRLYLARPGTQTTRRQSPRQYDGYSEGSLALSAGPSGGLFYAWVRGRCLDLVCSHTTNEIKYVNVNGFGEPTTLPRTLVDHSQAQMDTYDQTPALATLSNGTIGIVWVRTLYNDQFQFNSNMFFAILAADGSVTVPPIRLTNNATWGTWNDLNVPRFNVPRIAGTDDGRFVMAWQRAHQETGGWVSNIYIAVRDAVGQQVKPVSAVTADTPGDSSFERPVLTPLANIATFLSWLSKRNGDDDIYFMALNSYGDPVKSATNLSVDETVVEWNNHDAVQLSDGRIVAVWEAWGCFPGEWKPRLRFAVLDANYDRVGNPVCLGIAPGASGGDGEASIAADPYGHGIITWMDWGTLTKLYYALIDGNRNVLTPPMIFLTSASENSYIFSSFEGHGTAAYDWAPPGGVDGAVRLENNQPEVAAGATADVTVHYANHGSTIATGVKLALTLNGGMTYVSDTSG
ncbi:MAG: hypothetical protein IPM84_27080 [Anaerolineae bacterium]|nr:hypothetical protein [Anaerolineae bacterium]